MDEKAVAKFLDAEARARLDRLATALTTLAPWDVPAIEAAAAAFLGREGVELKVLAQPVRVALVGRPQSPGLWEVMTVLGRDKTVARLRRAAQGPA